MINRKLALLTVSLPLICISIGFSQDSKDPPPSPEVIEKQIKDAQAEFDEARKMFNPWYAGPLITPSAHIIPPGYCNIQPYLFITDNYARYTSTGKSVDIDHLLQVNPNVILQIGILKWMDAIISVQALYNSQSNESALNVGDTSLSLGFGIQDETPYLPAVLFSIKESFPSGKFEHFNRERAGVQGTGSGSYATTFSLNFSKVVWWLTLHPMNLRLSLNYTIPAPVSVEGFNAYGGGYGTDGKVKPGNSFAADFGYEYSFTQRWVAALDVVYSYTSPTHFSGFKGVDKQGAVAAVGEPFGDQLSLAPALEYNPNENLGLLAGVWFTVYGRNTLDFASAVISFTLTW